MLLSTMCAGVVLLLLGGCAGVSQPVTQTSSERVTLLAFNDFHGNLEPPGGTVTVRHEGALVRVPAGGAAYLAGLIRDQRASSPNPIVVGAGDLIGASPFISAAFNDEAAIEALGAMGLQYASVGNHEFDRGRDELLRLQHGGCAKPSDFSRRGVVGVDTCMNNGRFDGAKFQYLAANVFDAASGKTLFPAYSIHSAGRAKVAFIGMTLKDTPKVVTPLGVRGLRFDDEAATVSALMPTIKREGAQAVVVLIHQGGGTTATFANDQSCPGFSGDIVALADALDEAVDVVVSAHTHREYICRRPNGRLITSAGFYGQFLTRIDLEIDLKAGRVLRKEANSLVAINERALRDAQGQVQALPVGLAPVRADEGVLALIQRYAALTEPIQAAPVGRITESLTRSPLPSGETLLGNAVADAYLHATRGQGAVAAFTNMGGLRADIAFDAARQGEVSFGQIYAALPFGNSLITLDMTGAQLRRLLEQQWEERSSGGRMLQVSGSLSYAWDAAKPEGAGAGKGARVVPGSLKIDGKPVSDEATYRVTVNNFMASGGDGFTVLNQGANRTESVLDLAAFESFLKTHTPPKGSIRPRIARIGG